MLRRPLGGSSFEDDCYEDQGSSSRRMLELKRIQLEQQAGEDSNDSGLSSEHSANSKEIAAAASALAAVNHHGNLSYPMSGQQHFYFPTAPANPYDIQPRVHFAGEQQPTSYYHHQVPTGTTAYIQMPLQQQVLPPRAGLALRYGPVGPQPQSVGGPRPQQFIQSPAALPSHPGQFYDQSGQPQPPPPRPRFMAHPGMSLRSSLLPSRTNPASQALSRRLVRGGVPMVASVDSSDKFLQQCAGDPLAGSSGVFGSGGADHSILGNKLYPGYSSDSELTSYQHNNMVAAYGGVGGLRRRPGPCYSSGEEDCHSSPRHSGSYGGATSDAGLYPDMTHHPTARRLHQLSLSEDTALHPPPDLRYHSGKLMIFVF